jgi:hypothetical protein
MRQLSQLWVVNENNITKNRCDVDDFVHSMCTFCSLEFFRKISFSFVASSSFDVVCNFYAPLTSLCSKGKLVSIYYYYYYFFFFYY